MTGAVLDRSAAAEADAARGGASLHRATRDRAVTLEDRLSEALETARRRGSADCPVCHGPMRPAAVGAACDGCHSRLT